MLHSTNLLHRYAEDDWGILSVAAAVQEADAQSWDVLALDTALAGLRLSALEDESEEEAEHQLAQDPYQPPFEQVARPGRGWWAVAARLARAPAPEVEFASVSEFAAVWERLLREYSNLVRDELMSQVQGEAVTGLRRLVWTQYDLMAHGMTDMSVIRHKGLPLLLEVTRGSGIAWCVRINESVIDGVATTCRTYMDAMRHHQHEPDVGFMTSCCEIEARTRLGGMALCADGLPIYRQHFGAIQDIIDTSMKIVLLDEEIVQFMPCAVWSEHKKAFAMGTHARLGNNSAVAELDPDVVHLIGSFLDA